MTQQNERLVKKGVLKGIAYSRAKKHSCEKGELILTTEKLVINCEAGWTKTFPLKEYIRLESWNEDLEIYDIYAKLLFKLVVDEPKKWKRAFDEVISDRLGDLVTRIFEDEQNRPEELKKLLDMRPGALRKLYNATRKEREQFERKNIRFNLDIQRSWLWNKSKDRKLEAFIVAHSYLAWYEWSKRLIEKIFKAKFGKGPEDDKELMKFIYSYPSLEGFIDTTGWGIRANQIRNCVAHEKFYFDYKNSELVFMTKKEKRVKLRDLRTKMIPMSQFYIMLLDALKEKIEEAKYPG